MNEMCKKCNGQGFGCKQCGGKGYFVLSAVLVVDVCDVWTSHKQMVRTTQNGEVVDKIHASIMKNGLMLPIAITQDRNGFHVVDGALRLEAMKRAGASRISATLLPDTKETMARSLMASHEMVQTKPCEYAEHLRLVIARNPLVSRHELADGLGKSTTWIEHQLLLTTLTPKIQELIDAGKISASSGVTLAKLQDHDEQEKFTFAAVTETEMQLAVMVASRVKELQDVNRLLTQEKLLSPKERGKVLCLEADCRTWIKPLGPHRLLVVDYFCKKHRTVRIGDAAHSTRTMNEMPRVDRDGDAIWVTGQLEVKKIKDLDDGHLTNILCLLERNAKKRCVISSIDQDRWREKCDDRYAALLAEAQRRDAPAVHVCDCQDGLTFDGTPATSDWQAIPCTKCYEGRERQAAKDYEFDQKCRRAIFAATAVAFIVTGALGTGALQDLVAHLRGM